NPHAGPRLVVSAPPADQRPAYEELRLSAQWLSASEAVDLLPALVDGNRRTAWMTGRAQSPGAWIQVDLPRPRMVGRVELALTALLALLRLAAPAIQPPLAPPEMRGLWVVRQALVSPAAVDRVVDEAQRAGFIALFVQVRGRGDAFYRSALVPRSEMLAAQP